MKKRKDVTGILAAVLTTVLLAACGRPAPTPTETPLPAAQAGESAAVEAEYAPPATAEEFRAGFLDAVTSFHPGTAGSSLGRAIAATEVLQFVDDYDLLHAERAALAENLQAAWEALPGEEKEIFRENFAGLGELIAQAFDEPETVAGLFEDAGVRELEQRLLSLPELRDGWKVLESLGEELR